MKGLSLLEVLITILIFSFIIVAIYMVLDIGNLTFSTDIALLDLLQQSRLGMSWMVKDIRQASPSSIVITGGSRIDFNIPNIPNEPIAISYYLDNGQLIRESPSGSGERRIVANYINSLCFFCNTCADNCSNPNTLQIEVGAYKVAANGRAYAFSLKQKVTLRIN